MNCWPWPASALIPDGPTTLYHKINLDSCGTQNGADLDIGPKVTHAVPLPADDLDMATGVGVSRFACCIMHAFFCRNMEHSNKSIHAYL